MLGALQVSNAVTAHQLVAEAEPPDDLLVREASMQKVLKEARVHPAGNQMSKRWWPLESFAARTATACSMAPSTTSLHSVRCQLLHVRPSRADRTIPERLLLERWFKAVTASPTGTRT